MKKDKDNYSKEIKQFANELKAHLKKTNPDSVSDEQLNQLYAILHKLDETAGIFGVNTIVKLSSHLEELMSQTRNNTRPFTLKTYNLLDSSIEIILKLCDDHLLKNSALKVSYHNLLEEVSKERHSDTSKKKDAADDSESIMYNNKFQEVFIEEAVDLINQLEEKLLLLEAETEDIQLVNDVFRIMHTLKGNSNMFGYQHLGDITHHLESVYDDIRGEKLILNRDILNSTLQCVDHFRNLVEDPELQVDANKEFQQDMIQELQAYSKEQTKEPAITEKSSEDTSKPNIEPATYYLFFNPEADVFDDGTNPLYFVYDLKELGECLPIPNNNKLPANEHFDPTISYTCWHILLATSEGIETIKDQFMFLKDESQPSITNIAPTNLLSNKGFVADFTKAANRESIITDLERLVPKAAKIEKKKSAVKTKTVIDSSISSIRVAASKIDRMMNLISELVTKQAELTILAGESDSAKLQEVAEGIENISRDLRDNAFSISLIPLEKSVLRFQRLVRDVSAKFNKKVDFVVDGKDTELDKTIIEKIIDPIMHILRNSIDHGIETPAERLALGKPETGTIVLKAYPSGTHVVLEIKDDGSGINLDKVKKTAIKKGIVGQSEDLGQDDLLKLIISPGFSTADNISEVSGRGVGMDVVSQKIKEIRGELELKTEQDIGTTITIKLPLTISIIDSLLVTIGETYYLVPLSVVERCAEVSTEKIMTSENNYLVLDGEFIPFIDLHQQFDIELERDKLQRIILVSHKDLKVGLVVDNIIGNYQAVLKTLGEAYKKQEIISGASILGNGDIALVLDTNKIIAEFMDEDRVMMMKQMSEM